MDDVHTEIEIEGDTNWWKGFKRLATYAMFSTCYRFHGDEEYFFFDMEEQDGCDEFWDELLETLMARKKQWAKGAKKAAFIAQKKGQPGAVAKK